jgi:hypothetical protein
MPLQATSGAASYDAFGGGVPAAPPTYIEDVFSTWLYTGTGSAQTITNGIDVSTKGGLVWIKARSVAEFNVLVDSARGATRALRSSSTDAEVNDAGRVSAFTTSGFTIGTDGEVNGTGNTHASWTFRKQPKFFDVVTYTGTGSARTVAHNLGSAPGCIIVKKTNTTGAWYVYHRGLVPPAATAGTSAPQNYAVLNTTGEVQTLSTIWNNTAPTSTEFTVGSSAEVNASGASFVAYIFAHNAGGFGLAGTDNVITCGNYQGLGSGTGPVINLGFEPQWLLVKGVKDTAGSSNWFLIDNMRGWDVNGNKRDLSANTSSVESDNGSIKLTSTGFQPMGGDSSAFNGNQYGYIYIAIRRGPMKVPTTGTSVFAPIAYTGSGGTSASLTTNFPIDMTMFRDLRTGSVSALVSYNTPIFDRLRSNTSTLTTSNTNAEDTSWGNAYLRFDSNTTILLTGDGSYLTASGAKYVNHSFRRAPSFMDVVCYTGTGVARTVTHNLGVAPELIIVKNRVASNGWIIYCSYLSAPLDDRLFLNSSNAKGTSSGTWKTPTTTTWGMDINFSELNTNGTEYVSYLFATCAGVSKVGSYTGTGTTLQINCGFTAGARFVLIRRTNSASSDWYVWDSARGIIAGNDPYLLLNSTAAEDTSTDYIDTYSAGFEISSTAPAAINGSGDSFIFLAIA